MSAFNFFVVWIPLMALFMGGEPHIVGRGGFCLASDGRVLSTWWFGQIR